MPRTGWSISFRRSSPDATFEVEVVGRDGDGHSGFLRIGNGYHEPTDWNVREALWLWRRLPTAIFVAMFAYAVEVVRGAPRRLLRR